MYLSRLYINIDPTGQSSQKELCILTHDSKINDDRKNEEKHKVLWVSPFPTIPILSANTYIHKKNFCSKAN